MMVPNGKTTMTVHQNARDLSVFIKHLVASLCLPRKVHSELGTLNVTFEAEQTAESDTEFSGLSSVMGSIFVDCLLHRMLRKIMTLARDFSPCSSVILSGYDSDTNSFRIDDHTIENAVEKLDSLLL